MQASTLKSTSSIPIPPRLDASPAGVRQYMTDILHSVYHVPLQDATAFASNWRYGRGRELGLYDLSTFQSIFGGEVGALLYHYIAAQGTLFSNSPYHTAHISDSSKLKQKEDLFGMRQGGMSSRCESGCICGCSLTLSFINAHSL